MLYKDSRVVWESEPPLADSLGASVPAPSGITSSLESFDKQSANSKILGLFPVKLWFYQRLNANEEGFIKAWVNNGRGITWAKDQIRDLLYPEGGQELRDWFLENLGEEPVLYDTTLVYAAAEVMNNYLGNKGYFNADIEVEHQFKKQKGTAVYTIYPGQRLVLRNIEHTVSDTLIARLISQPVKNAPLKPGAPYRLEDFRAERLRIRDTLLNNGYFAFDRNFVEFELDTLIGRGQTDVYVHILEPSEDSLHRRYRIRNVYCFPDYATGEGKQNGLLDTIRRRRIYIISRGPLRFKPSALVSPIYIRPGTWYNAEHHTLTLRKFTELGAFKFVAIQYRDAPPDSADADINVLDAYIRLLPSPRQQWSVELNANTNFNSLIGSDLDFSYRNRNLFRNADLFSLNLNTGIETQIGQGETFIRNFDFSGTANLDIPKFIAPFRIRGSRTLNPVTSYAARYTYIQRIDFYTLHSTAVNVAYTWRRNMANAHRLSPVDINLVRPTEITEQFRAILNENLLLTQSFQQQIIPSASYTYLYNDVSLNGTRNGLFFRGSLEASGNLATAILGLGSNSDSVINIAGIPLAQYSRVQTDFRYYFNRTKEDSWVFRFATGVGLPYGNSATLPFIKQFSSGGPSSVRAWRIRRLGPGSFEAVNAAEQNVFIDQTGDIQLEANVEYRFPIYKLVKGAFFIDAGNIWLLEEDPTRPGGKIERDFMREIAIGTGVGLRLDFSFFVFRTDFGFRIKDPAIEGRDSWLLSRPQNYLDNFSRNTEFNIAIGYPF